MTVSCFSLKNRTFRKGRVLQLITSCHLKQKVKRTYITLLHSKQANYDYDYNQFVIVIGIGEFIMPNSGLKEVFLSPVFASDEVS